MDVGGRGGPAQAGVAVAEDAKTHQSRLEVAVGTKIPGDGRIRRRSGSKYGTVRNAEIIDAAADQVAAGIVLAQSHRGRALVDQTGGQTIDHLFHVEVAVDPDCGRARASAVLLVGNGQVGPTPCGHRQERR